MESYFYKNENKELFQHYKKKYKKRNFLIKIFKTII